MDLPKRCHDLLSEYKWLVDSYLLVCKTGEYPTELANTIKRMRKEYLMKCPLPDHGIPKVV